MPVTVTSRQNFKLVTLVLGITGLILTLLGWALASPVGASPDEDFHLTSTWCASGGQESICESTNSPATRLVSESLTEVACFKFEPEEGARCQADSQLFNTPQLSETSRGNFHGTYPDLFYSTMHMFASPNIQVSVITMRIFNAILFAATVTALWIFLPRTMRNSLYFSLALTVIPLGLFLIPSVNPSSWAITGVFAAFFGAAGALQQTNRKVIFPLIALALIGLLLAGGARWDGLIYSLIAVSAAFILSKRFRIPRGIFWISGGIAAVLLALILMLGGLDLTSQLAGYAGSAENADGRGFLGLLAYNIANLTELWAGFSGENGLGWLDTPLPPTAWMTAATVLWGTLFLRLAHIGRSQMWVAVSLLALLVSVPLLTLQLGNSIVGENVQARYIFPLLIVLVGTVLLDLRVDSSFFSKSQLIVIVVSLFLSQALALFTNMTRYISGMGGGLSLDLNQSAVAGWWWPVGPSPMIVLAASILGFGMFLAAAFVVNKSVGANRALEGNGAATL